MDNLPATWACFRDLREEVGRLAGDPAAVEKYLRDLGTWDCLDELALEFARSFEYLQKTKSLSAEQEGALGRISDELRRISGPDHQNLWHGIDALRSPEWEEIRMLASDALPLIREGV